MSLLLSASAGTAAGFILLRCFYGSDLNWRLFFRSGKRRENKHIGSNLQPYNVQKMCKNVQGQIRSIPFGSGRGLVRENSRPACVRAQRAAFSLNLITVHLNTQIVLKTAVFFTFCRSLCYNMVTFYTKREGTV